MSIWPAVAVLVYLLAPAVLLVGRGVQYSLALIEKGRTSDQVVEAIDSEVERMNEEGEESLLHLLHNWLLWPFYWKEYRKQLEKVFEEIEEKTRPFRLHLPKSDDNEEDE